jgi:hypothetical protein
MIALAGKAGETVRKGDKIVPVFPWLRRADISFRQTERREKSFKP